MDLTPITNEPQQELLLRELMLDGHDVDEPERTAANQRNAITRLGARLAGDEVFAALKDSEAWQAVLDSVGHMLSQKDLTDCELMVAAILQCWSVEYHDSGPNWALLQAASSEFDAPMRDDCLLGEMWTGESALWSSAEVQIPLRHFVRAMYAETQQQLTEAGIESIRAYRGVRYDFAIEHCPFAPGSHEGNPHLNSLSAFTVDFSMAKAFATNSEEQISDSVIIGATIPAHRIVSLPTSGIGWTRETELVIMGGSDDIALVHCTEFPDYEVDTQKMPHGLDQMHPRPPLGKLTNHPENALPSTDLSIDR